MIPRGLLENIEINERMVPKPLQVRKRVLWGLIVQFQIFDSDSLRVNVLTPLALFLAKFGFLF